MSAMPTQRCAPATGWSPPNSRMALGRTTTARAQCLPLTRGLHGRYCAWRRTNGDSHYRQVARRQLDWTLARQHPNGWFDFCTFDRRSAPVTHTLAYTAEKGPGSRVGCWGKSAMSQAVAGQPMRCTSVWTKVAGCQAR